MKGKIAFLFLFVTLAFANSAYSYSYFGYDSFAGTWYDANKTLSNTLDDGMCLSAAASNVLMYTGWDAGFSNADAIFAEIQNRWAPTDLGVGNAWSWWLSGTYTIWSSPTQYTTYADNSGGGNFYPSYQFAPNFQYATYFHKETNTSLLLSAMDNFLHSGYGVTLTISTPWGGQHTVTGWGYEYDAQGNYLGIYITDSDDYNMDNPPATMNYYQVIYNDQDLRWYIQDYQLGTANWGNAWYIHSARALERNPDAVPEPATMLLLGSGLIGLAGYGRKKFFKR